MEGRAASRVGVLPVLEVSEHWLIGHLQGLVVISCVCTDCPPWNPCVSPKPLTVFITKLKHTSSRKS